MDYDIQFICEVSDDKRVTICYINLVYNNEVFPLAEGKARWNTADEYNAAEGRKIAILRAYEALSRTQRAMVDAWGREQMGK